MKGQLKADNDYQCMKCKFPETGTTGSVTGKEFIALVAGASIECVNEFCYFGDTLGFGGGAGDASRKSQMCVEEVQIALQLSQYQQLEVHLLARFTVCV